MQQVNHTNGGFEFDQIKWLTESKSECEDIIREFNKTCTDLYRSINNKNHTTNVKGEKIES